MNFYKRHLGDIAKSCSDLSQGQMGAYDLLLDWHYANEKPLPLAADKLYRIGRARTKTERSNVDSVLLELFIRTSEGYTHKRAGEEIMKANAQADVNRTIAIQREADKRKAIQDAKPLARTVQPIVEPIVLTSCDFREPSQTPDSRFQKEQETRSKAVGASASGSRLDPTWQPTPELLAWAKTARPDVDLTQATETFRDHWASQPGVKGRKLDWPATWRNWIRSPLTKPKTNGATTHAHRPSAVERVEAAIRKRRAEEDQGATGARRDGQDLDADDRSLWDFMD